MQLYDTLIQVAGVCGMDEAEMLIQQGVTHLGLPLGPGVREQDVSLGEAAEMVEKLADRATFVLITYLTQPAEIIALCRRVGVSAVQLHADLAPAAVARLREREPDLFIIKSLVVGDGDVLELARAYSPHVDAFLTDTFDPRTGARGATGKVHDWAVSQAVVQAVDRPVILAGGLGPDNVAQAVAATGAAGVDAHTGLEDSDGRKDETAVRAFVQRALAALKEQ